MTDITDIKTLKCYQEFAEENRQSLIDLAIATKEQICKSEVKSKQYIDNEITRLQNEVDAIVGIDDLSEKLGQFEELMKLINPDGDETYDFINNTVKDLERLKQDNQALVDLIKQNEQNITNLNQQLADYKTQTDNALNQQLERIKNSEGNIGVLSKDLTSVKSQLNSLETINEEAVKDITTAATCKIFAAIAEGKKADVLAFKAKMEEINCNVYPDTGILSAPPSGDSGNDGEAPPQETESDLPPAA